MVQVIETGNPQGKLAEMLGMSLGEGLGNGLNTFFANRSLDSVLKDKALEKAPISKKLEAIRSALSPYGEKGQEIFQQRMNIEQQEMNEKQEAIQKQKGQALGRYFNGEQLTPDEQSMFSPTEFVAMHKAKNKAAGGVTAQPVPPDVSQKITEILDQSQGMSSDDVKNIMDNAGIPPIYSNQYVENRRRSEEIGTKQDIQLHQESSDFEKEVNKNANTARHQLPLIQNGIKAVSEGKIKPSSMANIFNLFGETGKKISNAILSGDQAALLSSVPEFLEGRKELFGVRLSDADLRLLQDKLPDIGKSKEANLAILNLMKKSAQRSLKFQKVAQDVFEKKGLPYRGGKLRPLGYEREVIKAFDEFDRNEGTLKEPPPPAENNGRVIEDDYGNRFKSNGTDWEPI